MSFKPLNILLADDDMDDRHLFDKALAEIPFTAQLTSVRDGEQLMEYLTANYAALPDILFLDLSMPRKTGFECLSEIKENDKLKNIPVIVFTTSFGRSSDFEKELTCTLTMLGARKYVRKPGSFEELKAIIHKALSELIELQETQKLTKDKLPLTKSSKKTKLLTPELYAITKTNGPE